MTAQIKDKRQKWDHALEYCTRLCKHVLFLWETFLFIKDLTPTYKTDCYKGVNQYIYILIAADLKIGITG